MDDAKDLMTAYWERVRSLLPDKGSGVDFRMFADISDRFLAEYRQLQADGLPEQTIVLAMLGATLNLSAMLGAHRQLTPALKDLANLLEQNRVLH